MFVCLYYATFVVNKRIAYQWRIQGDAGDAAASPSARTKIFERLYFGHCGETADQIRMPFGVIGRTGPGMRQVVGFGDRSSGRGTFGGEFRARHCNKWGLYGVRVHFRSDAALFPNYFGLVITGNGDDAANDFNKYKMLRNL